MDDQTSLAATDVAGGVVASSISLGKDHGEDQWRDRDRATGGEWLSLSRRIGGKGPRIISSKGSAHGKYDAKGAFGPSETLPKTSFTSP